MLILFFNKKGEITVNKGMKIYEKMLHDQKRETSNTGKFILLQSLLILK